MYEFIKVTMLNMNFPTDFPSFSISLRLCRLQLFKKEILALFQIIKIKVCEPSRLIIEREIDGPFFRFIILFLLGSAKPSIYIPCLVTITK